MSDNEAVDWFETVRAVPRDLLRESPGWIYSQRKEAEEHGQQFREDDQQCVIDLETLNEKNALLTTSSHLRLVIMPSLFI
jgi:hypothetical protein